MICWLSLPVPASFGGPSLIMAPTIYETNG